VGIGVIGTFRITKGEYAGKGRDEYDLDPALYMVDIGWLILAFN